MHLTNATKTAERGRAMRSANFWSLLVTAVLFSLAGCAAPITVTQTTRSEVIDFPEIGIEVTRGIGDRLVAKGVRVTGPAILAIDYVKFGKAVGEGSIMTCAFTVAPGTYFKRGNYKMQSGNADCFGAASAQTTLADGSTNFNCPGQLFVGDICVDDDDRYFFALGPARHYLEQDFEKVSVTTGVVNSPTNFVQELLYNGRVGDNLRFVYREFSNDIIRPAFTQEVQYDYGASQVVGFKQLRLEVVEATNTALTYKLLQNF
jgi:hypothetical protein